MTDFEKKYMDGAAPFYVNLAKCETISINGNPTLTEEYNLIISKRDFALYESGMKPNRNWSFNATKKYYGITGNATVARAKFLQLYSDFIYFKNVHLKYEKA